MKISVVIPAFNEAELLPRALAALMPQAAPQGAEVIVVNNNSNDATPDIANRAGARVVHEARAGYVFAMQRGLDEATGDIVAFTDADSVVGPEWLAAIHQSFAAAEVISATGPVRFERMRWLSWWRVFSPTSVIGSNMAVRRSVAMAAGGFDTGYNLASDIEFNWRIKGRGRMIYHRDMAVSTSSRRFQAHPYREGSRYILNYAWMLLFRRPLFWHFAPVRHSPDELTRRERKNFWLATLTLTFITLLYLSLWPSSSDFGQIATRGRTKTKEVALTFDDGPNGQATRQIVDILSAAQVPATFFEVGRSIAADPATSRYVFDHGFMIGNHSWDHSFRLPYFTPHHIAIELQSTSDIIQQTTGWLPTYFRPPHGFRSPQLLYEAKHQHLKVVNWTVDPLDYNTGDAIKIARDVVGDVRPGSIVLLHDGLQDGWRVRQLADRRGTITALPQIISGLRQRGFTFVTLDQLLPSSNRPSWINRLTHRETGPL